MEKLDKLRNKYHLRKVEPVKNRNVEYQNILTRCRDMDRGVVLKKKPSKNFSRIFKVNDLMPKGKGEGSRVKDRVS